MELPTPLPEPLTLNTGLMTMTLAVFINVDLDQATRDHGGAVNGAGVARLLDQAVKDAKLPAGCTVGDTLLQLAVHSPR